MLLVQLGINSISGCSHDLRLFVLLQLKGAGRLSNLRARSALEKRDY